MRLPVALRDAAALAVVQFGTAPSTTTMTAAALRHVLETVVMEAALRLHYEQHPSATPTLGEVAFALAVQDGSPLADRPDLIASAAVAVAARRPDADAAARIQSATSTGVADAHIGATVRSLSPAEVVVLTSDPADIAAVCSPAPVTIVHV